MNPNQPRRPSNQPEVRGSQEELRALRERYTQIAAKFDRMNFDKANFNLGWKLSSDLINSYHATMRSVNQQTGENRPSSLEVASQLLDDLEFYHKLITKIKPELYAPHRLAGSAGIMGSTPAPNFIKELRMGMPDEK